MCIRTDGRCHTWFERGLGTRNRNARPQGDAYLFSQTRRIPKHRRKRIEPQFCAHCFPPSLNYSRFCWRKKKRCSKRLMNTGFSKNPAFSFGAPKDDILLYTTALVFLLPTSSHSSRFFWWTDHQ